MKKKVLALFLSTVVIGALFSGCGKTNKEDVIKIGSIGPLTGPAATYGQSVKNAVQLVEKQVNEKGGIKGKKVQFIFEDDQADQNAAINAFNKLVDNEKVNAILGPVTSGATLAVASKATQAKIPLLTPTATEPTITKVGGEFVFRGCFIDSFQGITMANFTSQDLSKRKAAVLFNVSSDYSKGIAEAYKTQLEKNGGTVVEYLSYNKDDKDFNAQLTKIKSSGADVLFLPDYYNVVGLIAKQARDIGITSQFLGVDGWDSEELYKIGGDAVTGTYFVNHFFPGDKDKEVAEFVEAYKKEYNKEPDALAALSYDSCKALIKAFEDADSLDGDKIREALSKVEIVSSTGKISFGADRTAVKGAVILKVEGPNKSLVKKVNP